MQGWLRVWLRFERHRSHAGRGVGRVGPPGPPTVAHRLRRAAVAAEPAQPVGAGLDFEDFGLGLRQEMHRAHFMLGSQARAAAQVERPLGGVPAGLHEEVGERRVGFVGALGRQGRFGGQTERQGQRHVAAVGQLHLAQLAVVFRAHPDRRAHEQVRPLAVEDHTVGLHAAAVRGKRVGSGVSRHRVARAGDAVRVAAKHSGLSPQVKERSTVVAQQVVAPACQALALPLAGAGAVAAQGQSVAAVAQPVRGRQRILQRCAGMHQRLAQDATLARQRRRVAQHRSLARCPFVQQAGHRPQTGFAPRPALRCTVRQHRAGRHQRHRLVVAHVGFHKAVGSTGGLALRAVVDGLDEAESPPRAQRLQRPQVGHCRRRRHQQRQRAGIGCQHALVGGRATQRQTGNTLWAVLVGQGVVLRRNRRL